VSSPPSQESNTFLPHAKTLTPKDRPVNTSPTSPTLFERLTAVFRPGSGKRRKGHVRPEPAIAKKIPPRPTHAPVYPTPVTIPENAFALDYGEIERMLWDRLAKDGLGALTSFRDMYRVEVRPTREVPRVPTRGTVTGRVMIRSDNPEMDAWITRTAKTLVRPSDVPNVSPTHFRTPEVPGLRIRLMPPVKAPVSVVPTQRGGSGAGGVAVLTGTRTASSEDDLSVTDAWARMFDAIETMPTVDTHVCRRCMRVRQGIARADGTWQCSECMTMGNY
jgi:hypothetical protein